MSSHHNKQKLWTFTIKGCFHVHAFGKSFFFFFLANPCWTRCQAYFRCQEYCDEQDKVPDPQGAYILVGKTDSGQLKFSGSGKCNKGNKDLPSFILPMFSMSQFLSCCFFSPYSALILCSIITFIVPPTSSTHLSLLYLYFVWQKVNPVKSKFTHSTPTPSSWIWLQKKYNPGHLTWLHGH